MIRADFPSCPVELTLRIIGDKWKVLIVRDLLEGTRRFGALRKSIPGVSQKMLTQQLRSMENDGLIRREVFAEVPMRVEYSLTELGQSLEPVLNALMLWGETYRESCTSGIRVSVRVDDSCANV